MASNKQAMYRHEAKKALILQKRRVRANQERLGLRATDPDPIREKELDHMKLLLLENHLLLLNDTKEEDKQDNQEEDKEHEPKMAKGEDEKNYEQEETGNNFL